jgi:hypothetical protein
MPYETKEPWQAAERIFCRGMFTLRSIGVEISLLKERLHGPFDPVDKAAIKTYRLGDLAVRYQIPMSSEERKSYLEATCYLAVNEPRGITSGPDKLRIPN